MEFFRSMLLGLLLPALTYVVYNGEWISAIIVVWVIWSVSGRPGPHTRRLR